MPINKSWYCCVSWKLHNILINRFEVLKVHLATRQCVHSTFQLLVIYFSSNKSVAGAIFLVSHLHVFPSSYDHNYCTNKFHNKTFWVPRRFRCLIKVEKRKHLGYMGRYRQPNATHDHSVCRFMFCESWNQFKTCWTMLTSTYSCDC